MREGREAGNFIKNREWMPCVDTTSETRTVTAHSRSWLLSGVRIVASMTLLSRVLGMFRDMATAWLFGVGPVMDAFALAFRIPNLARRLFGEGALSAAFLPVFSREWERGAAGHPWALATAVLSWLAGLLLGLVLLGEAVLLALAWLPGTEPRTQLLLGLTAVMLPYAVCICLAAQVTAVLNALGEFRIPALVPVLLNLCLLATIFLVDPWLEPHRERQAYALAVCVLVAGMLQLGLQWPMLRRLGFRFTAGWRDVQGPLGEIVRAVLPVTLGLSITQINTVLDSVIAWLFSRADGGSETIAWLGHVRYPLDPGAVATLYYGERLYQFPVGVFGIALGTVLFPLLARHAARGDFSQLRNDLGLSLRLAFTIGIPASVGLMTLASPIARLLFEHGQFSERDAQRTAAMISAYGASVWAYCAIPLLYRAFYALEDRQAPIRVGIGIVGLDFLLNISLIWVWAERGLAWSTAITAVVQVVILVWLLQQRIGPLGWKELLKNLVKVIVCTGGMALVVLGVAALLPPGTSHLARGLAVALPVATGLAAYLALAWWLQLDELWLLLRSPLNRPPGRTSS